MPDAFEDAALLCIRLDQGSIGGAGMAYCTQELKLRVHSIWDKFHRVIRDNKDAMKHAAGGVFLKAQLLSSFVFGLNYKPFDTGGFSQKKARLLS